MIEQTLIKQSAEIAAAGHMGWGNTMQDAAALVLIVVVVLIGMRATWRDCTAAGGQTVRGLFGLECIK